MQNPKRRQYTAAFRHDATRLVTEHGYGVTEAARNLGSNAKMWGRWKRQSEQQNHGVSRGHGQLSVDHDELLRLRKAVKRLRMEREMVKKAALFVATESRCNTPSLLSISIAGRYRCWVRCWELGAAGCMTTKSDRQRPCSVMQRSTGLRVSRRYPKRQLTVMAVVAW